MRDARFGRHIALPLFALSFSLSAIPVWGQAAIVVTGTPTTNAPNANTPPAPFRPPASLKDAMGLTYWSGRARGPLLAIGAENIRPWQPKREPGDYYTPGPQIRPLDPPDADGYRADLIAPYFGQRTVRLPTLTVFAPAEMTVLNTELKGKPDPFSGMQSGQKMQLLMATLTTGQWRALGSESGLGVSDLNSDQKQLFLSLIPSPMRVMKMKSYPGGGWGPVYDRDESGRMMPTQQTLDGGVRQQVRLRMNRQVSMMIPSAANDKQWGASVNNRPVNGEFLQLTNLDNYAKPEAFGVKLKDDIPSKLKPGQLDFAAPALDARISLEGVKTVGDLVGRVRKETRLDIFADGRFANLSVMLLGTDEAAPVRAGDLLKALGWAVTGAFRRVGDAFVLTNDIEGLGVRRARIAEWAEQGDRVRNQLTQQASQRIREQQPLQYFGFDSKDPFALDAKMMGRVEESWKKPETRWSGDLMPINDLPEALQQQARTSLEEYNKNSQQSAQRPVLTDRVRLNVRTRLTFMVPGMGEAEVQEGGVDVLSTMLPLTQNLADEKKLITAPVVLPPRLAAQAALLLSPDTAEELAQLPAVAAAAKARGVKQLWITLPLDSQKDSAVIKAAVAAAKPHGLSVLPVVRLLVAPPIIDPANATDRDRNILDETTGIWAARRAALPETWPGQNATFTRMGDWLRPDAPGLALRLKRRLREIAALPGVSAIVLTDVAPPGYRAPNDSGDFFYSNSTGEDVGYTPEMRLSLLRDAGYDPIDLLSGGSYLPADISIPNFGDGQNRGFIRLPSGDYGPDPKAVTPGKSWNKLRYDKVASLLTELHKAFRSEDVKTPLFVRDLTSTWVGWYGSWDTADKLPSLPNSGFIYSENGPTPQQSALTAAHAASKQIVAQISCTSVMFGRPTWVTPDTVEAGSPAAFRRLVNSQLESMKKSGMDRAWDGLVLDMTGVPSTNLIRFLNEGMGPGSMTAVSR